MKTRFLAAVVFLLSPMAAWAQPLSDRVPENALLYVGWQGVEALPAAYEQSHLKAILDASNIRALAEDFLPRLLDRIARENPDAKPALQLFRAIAGPMWRRPWAMWFGGLDFGDVQQGQPPVPMAGLICQAGPEAESLFEALKEPVAALAEGAPFRIKAFRHEQLVGVLLGYFGEQSAVAGLAADGPRPIRANPEFQQASARVHREPVAILYVNVQGLVGMVDRGMQLLEDPESRGVWEKIRDGLGLPGVQRKLLTAGFDGPDWSVQAFLAAPAPRKGLLSVLEGKPVSDESLKLVPFTATTTMVGHLDLAELFDWLTALVRSIDADAGQQMDQALGEVNQAIGMDLRRDVLGCFGQEWLLYADPASSGTGPLGLVLVNRLGEPAKAEQALSRLEQLLIETLGREMAGQDVKLSLRQDKIGSLTVHTLSVPLVAPSWAISEGVLYVGLYPQVVVAAAARHPKTVLENPDFQALRKRLGAENAIAFSFFDLRKTAPQSYPELRALLQLGLGLAEMFGVRTPPTVLPPLDKLMQDLGPAGGMLRADQDGWHFKAVAPFPGSAMLAESGVVGPGAAGFLFGMGAPAFFSARSRAQQVACASNLKQIGLGLIIYQDDHGGKLPARLSEISPYVGNYRVFRCPARRPPTLVPPRADDPEILAKWIDENCDYVYIPGQEKKQRTDPARTILAFEKPENHRNQWMNVLFADGHVERMPIGLAKEQIRIQQGK